MHAQAGHAPKSLHFKHCDETHGVQDEKHTLRVTRIHRERKLCKVKRRRKQTEGGKEQSKCKSVVMTAAQASPGGASKMGWKTNQGHRGDFATVLVPISSSCGPVYYTSLISHINKN